MSVRAPRVSPARFATLRITPLSLKPCLIWPNVLELRKRFPWLNIHRPAVPRALERREPTFDQLIAPPRRLESPRYPSRRAQPPTCGESAA
ncbi:viral protein [Fowl aviadenovirus D]|nr:viral protein [Fowl aviadenovirus D]